MAGQTPTGKYATDLDKAVKEVKESYFSHPIFYQELMPGF